MPRQGKKSSASGSARFVPYFKAASPKPSTLRRTVEYLGVCNDPSAYRSVIRASTDPVVKTICNAALNVERGSIKLSPSQKTLFRQHRKQIAKLTSRRVGLDTKRRIIEQRGSGFFIPALISAAISGLAGALFGGNKEWAYRIASLSWFPWTLMK